MTNKQIQNFISKYNDLEKYPTVKDVATALGNKDTSTIRRKAKKVRELGYTLTDRSKGSHNITKTETTISKTEIETLKKESEKQNKINKAEMESFVIKYNDLHNNPTINSMTEDLDLSVDAIRRKANKAKQMGYKLIDRKSMNENIKKEIASLENKSNAHYKLKIHEQSEKISALQSELKDSQKILSSSEKMKSFVFGMSEVKINETPSWIEGDKKSSLNNDSHAGIPVLFLSDIHYDEVVSSSQIQGINEYNREIANKRLIYTFNKAEDILTKHINHEYDGIIIAMGGDMLSGNIHEELAETNEAPILESASILAEQLIAGIVKLQKKFKKVFIPCVVGNHGRFHKRVQMKNRVKDNYEYVVYQYIAMYFKKNKNITVYIPDGTDAVFSVYNTRFLLTHGDQFRGGNGIGGVQVPIMRGQAKKSKNYVSFNKPFDIMMIGHFHQYIHTESTIINGSVKGMDEYAMISNFQAEDPKQALFIVHPIYGVTYRCPITCNGYQKEEKHIKANENTNSIKVF